MKYVKQSQNKVLFKSGVGNVARKRVKNLIILKLRVQTSSEAEKMCFIVTINLSNSE